MVRDNFKRFNSVTYVPELSTAIIPTAGQVVLFVGVEVQVSYQLTMSILYTIHLSKTKML